MFSQGEENLKALLAVHFYSLAFSSPTSKLPSPLKNIVRFLVLTEFD